MVSPSERVHDVEPRMSQASAIQRRDGINPAETDLKHCRRRTGCLTCRHRKKKCDEIFDDSHRCQACSRMGLHCKRIPVFDPFKDAEITVSSDQSQSLPALAHDSERIEDSHLGSGDTTLQTVLPCPRSIELNNPTVLTRSVSSHLDSISYEALHYYLTRLIPCRATYHDEETGFDALISRAIDQPLMMDALLSFSLAHQAESSSTPTYPMSRDNALRQYGKVIQGYRTLLTSENLDSETSATIAILLIETEATNGRMTDWHVHSKGATVVLNDAKHKLDPKLNKYHRFLTRSLIYYDVLSAVTLGTRPILDRHFYVQERNNSVSQKVHSMLAANSLLLAILADVCHLGVDVSNTLEAGLTVDFDAMYQRADRLDCELSAAVCPGFHTLLISFLFEAYRNASFLYLYQLLHHADPVGFQIGSIMSRYRTRLQHLMYYISRIPGDSPPASALLYPLFIGGVSTSDEDDKALILSKLGGIHDLLRFGNIVSVRQVLQTIWASEDILTGNLDWQRMLKRTETRVTLF